MKSAIATMLVAQVALAQPSPAPEASNGRPLVLPDVPAFELPVDENGVTTPRSLRVLGKRKFGTTVTVRGTITWIYDCLAAERRPKETKAKAQKRIDDDGTLCEIPKFYLGDSATTPFERALWVVSVPRAANKQELKVLSKEELAKRPPVPNIKVGDVVEVTGTFDQKSPMNEQNSDGLLVYGSIATANARTGPVATKPIPRAPTPKVAIPNARAKTPVADTERREARRDYLACQQAYAQGKAAEAVTKCSSAVTRDPNLAAAYYMLAGAYIAQKQWGDAAVAAGQAVAIDPTAAMHHMVHGYTRYLEAKDTPAPNFDAAEQSLRLAIHFEPMLWRAHYYLGAIHRERGYDYDAALELTAAVTSSPPEGAPYVALGELYRKWERSDLALAVLATTAQITDGMAAVLHVKGLAYADTKAHAEAIEMFTQALEADPSNDLPRYSRALSYLALKKRKKAKADLEEFVANAPDGVYKTSANQRLLELK